MKSFANLAVTEKLVFSLRISLALLEICCK